MFLLISGVRSIKDKGALRHGLNRDLEYAEDKFVLLNKQHESEVQELNKRFEEEVATCKRLHNINKLNVRFILFYSFYSKTKL